MVLANSNLAILYKEFTIRFVVTKKQRKVCFYSLKKALNST